MRPMVVRFLAAFMLCCAALAGMSSAEAASARPAAVEIKGPKGALGQLPLQVMDDGLSYVAAERLASLLKGSWAVKGKTGTLTVARRSVQFSRDQSRLTLQGQPVILEGAPRVTAKGWLIPADFLDKGLGRLAPGVSAARPAVASAKPPVRRVDSSVAFEELRFRSYPSFTRIVVEAAARLSYLTAPGKSEIRVRLGGLNVPGLHLEEIGDGLVKEARLESVGPDAVLNITLEGPASDVKTASLLDPFRVVVDIYRAKESAGTEGSPRIRNGGAPPLKLIVLDAGHGGHDPGARGPNGVQEKDVVLDVTKRAARMIEDGLGIKVVMTRSTDVFVPLRERTNFANKQRADLFVSIHANAHPRSVSEGVETYFLSSEATDNEARQTAAIENNAVQLESPQSRQRTDVLKSILWDMAQSEFQQESSFLAETVQDSMTQSLRLVNRGVKQAGFYVLGGAAMPAILIEIGFLTNPKEERKLASAEHREAIARAVYASLAEYKRRYDQRVRTVQTQPVKGEAGR
jgi:N-acetylmuramoyl-L-alanine amidase